MGQPVTGSEMRLGFILPTIGEKPEDLARSIASTRSDLHNCTVLLVDQSLVPLEIEAGNQTGARVQIEYTDVRGLSRARNIGLDHIQADIIAFPDDDSYYADSTIDDVVRNFEADSALDVLVIRQVDPTNLSSPFGQKRESFPVTEKELAYVGNSICIFVRKNERTQSVRFDDQLGAGRYYGSHEERDYLAQIIENGAKVLYDGSIVVYHRIDGFGEWAPAKTLSYARGMGAYFKKHHANKTQTIYWLILRPMVGVFTALISFNFHKLRYRVLRIVGNIQGYMRYASN